MSLDPVSATHQRDIHAFNPSSELPVALDATRSTPTGFPEPTPSWRRKWPEMHNLTSTLCGFCNRLLRDSQIIQRYPSLHTESAHEVVAPALSLVEVSRSAAAGCHLCAMAWLSQSFSMPRGLVVQHTPDAWNQTLAGIQFKSKEARIAVHAFRRSKFGSEEPYTSLHWDLGNHYLDTKYDMRVYEVPQIPDQIPHGLSRGDFINSFSQEQINHCMIPRARSTSSADTTLLASWWLQSCLRHHTHCGPSQVTMQDIPARLLKISRTNSNAFGTTSGLIKLRRINSDNPDSVPKYLALSHCWGKSQRLKLTKDNLASCYESINPLELPRTIQDAIKITRRLGYGYLWVDSLCIIQDSSEDWKEESVKMAGIYGNAQCTIAALGSRDDDEGCFHTRPAFFGRFVAVPGHGGYLQVMHPQSKTYEQEYEAIGPGSAPLNQRAWTVQERILSPRTLYYGSTGIFWECREADAADTNPMGVPSSPSLRRELKMADKHIMTTLLQPIVDSSSAQRFHSQWAILVELYTGCALTHLSDREHAIQGFARPIMRDMKLTSLACLWKEYLHTELLWSTPRFSYTKRVSSAPTWSWTSTAGPARLYYHPWKVSPAEYEGASKPQWKADIFRVKTGAVPSLMIESFIVPVRVFEERGEMQWRMASTSEHQPAVSEVMAGMMARQSVGVGGYWLPDVDDALAAKDVHLLPIIENSLHSVGLVVTLGGGQQQNQCHRIGSFVYHHYNGWFARLRGADRQVIELL